MLGSHWCCCVLYLSPRMVSSVGDPSSVSQGPTCRALPECEQSLQAPASHSRPCGPFFPLSAPVDTVLTQVK